MAKSKYVAELRIDPHVIEQMGLQQYRTRPIHSILVRELMQNAIDACRVKGVTPKITISVYPYTHPVHGVGYRIVCEDNGIGMSDEDIWNRFLMLSKQTKAVESGQTGHFGIAKAVIFSCTDWSVKTRDCYLDKEMFLNHDYIDVQVEPYLDGTVVDCFVAGKFDWSNDVDELHYMIYLSEVRVHYRFADNGSWIIDDEHAGISTIDMNSEWKQKVEGWNNYLFEPTIINGIEVKRLNIVRLNGLVQFVEKSWSRDTNLLADVLAKGFTPEEGVEYPFTPNREQLVGKLYQDVRNFFNYYSENTQTAKNITRKVDPYERVEPGYLLCGKFEGDHLEPQKATVVKKLNRWDDEELSEKEFLDAVVKSIGKIEEFQVIIDAPQNVAGDLIIDDPAMLEKVVEAIKSGGGKVSYAPEDTTKTYSTDLKDDGKKYDTPACLVLHRKEVFNYERKYLKAWAILMTMCVPEGQNFGVGITGHPDKTGEKVYKGGIDYYLFNPDFLLNQDKEYAPYLLHRMCCHEAAHFYSDSHNETWSTWEFQIYAATLPLFIKIIKEIRKYFE